MPHRLTDSGPVKRGVNRCKSLAAFIGHNASNIFAGKFIYFLLLAIALLITIAVIYVLEEDIPPNSEAIYYFLLTPAVLLIFYPATYSIQSDIDSRMLETLFGIPDYRYKVYLVRILTQYLVTAALLLVMAVLCRLTLAEFSITSMIFHLMFPVIFLSSFGFMVSTITRSGNGTAVIMVVVILFFWIGTDAMIDSRWFLFHNPFTQTDAFETVLWAETTLYNRIYLIIGSVIATMFGLLRLQQREKFV